MKTIIALALVVAVGGCGATGGFVGSPHAMGGVLSTPFGDAIGVPNAMPSGDQVLSSYVHPDGSREDMRSAYIIKPDGTMIVTGPWVEYMALSQLCMRAPNARACGGPPPGMLAAFE